MTKPKSALNPWPTSSNRRRSVRSASPENFPRQSAPFLAKKAMGFLECFAQAPANARATSVFPDPGSPWSKIPLQHKNFKSLEGDCEFQKPQSFGAIFPVLPSIHQCHIPHAPHHFVSWCSNQESPWFLSAIISRRSWSAKPQCICLQARGYFCVPWWTNAKLTEDFRIYKWKHDHLLELFHNLFQSTHSLPSTKRAFRASRISLIVDRMRATCKKKITTLVPLLCRSWDNLANIHLQRTGCYAVEESS